MSARARNGRRVERTDDWEQLEILFGWPEQARYELIRPLVLFGEQVAERAAQTGTSASTLYRRTSRFEAEGMASLFDSEKARRRKLPPSVRPSSPPPGRHLPLNAAKPGRSPSGEEPRAHFLKLTAPGASQSMRRHYCCHSRKPSTSRSFSALTTVPLFLNPGLVVLMAPPLTVSVGR
jgi:hypothetical protein